MKQPLKKLKNALYSSPILSYPQSLGMFNLGHRHEQHRNRCCIVTGAGQERKSHRVLSKPEKNYCATKKELLAIVRAVEHFHKYLYGREFLIRTDHAAFTWLLQMKNSEGQVARWLERLQQYRFKIRRQAGKLHSNADSLLRSSCKNCKHCDKIEQRETSFNCGWTAVVEDEEWTTAQLRKDQDEDVDIGPLLKWKETTTLVGDIR